MDGSWTSGIGSHRHQGWQKGADVGAAFTPEMDTPHPRLTGMGKKLKSSFEEGSMAAQALSPDCSTFSKPGELCTPFLPAEPQCRGQGRLCKVQLCQESLQDVLPAEQLHPCQPHGADVTRAALPPLLVQQPGSSRGLVAPPGGTWSFPWWQSSVGRAFPGAGPFPILQEGSRAQQLHLSGSFPTRIFCDAQISPAGINPEGKAPGAGSCFVPHLEQGDGVG